MHTISLFLHLLKITKLTNIKFMEAKKQLDKQKYMIKIILVCLKIQALAIK